MKKEKNFLFKITDTKYELPSISKYGVLVAANKIYEEIMEGKMQATKAAEMFKFVDEVHKQIKELTDETGHNSFVDLVREEITLNSDDGKSFVTKNGTKMEITESVPTIDYSATNDPLWAYYKKEEQKLAEKRKEREAFLKTIKSTYPVGNILNPETGELYENIELSPVIKNSTSTYKQTLLKG
jgi:hypothetical protein